MGYSLSWIATKGLVKDIVYSRLQLSMASNPARGREGHIQSRDQPDGWRLVLLNEAEHPLLKVSHLATLSKGCTALACNIEEHVMLGSAEQWTDGQLLWRLRHQGDIDTHNLEVSGDPPHVFPKIEEECRSRQASDTEQPPVDFVFEIPPLVAKSITAFKHDESDREGFEPLQWQGRRTWWRFWQSEIFGILAAVPTLPQDRDP
ncbi:MAG: hypothetical protein AB7U95_15550 [Reyranella sp.]